MESVHCHDADSVAGVVILWRRESGESEIEVVASALQARIQLDCTPEVGDRCFDLSPLEFEN